TSCDAPGPDAVHPAPGCACSSGACSSGACPEVSVPEVPVPQVPGQGVPDAPAPAPAAAAPSRSGAPSRPPDPSGVSFTRTRGTRLPTRVTISYAIVPAACAQSWAVGSP